MPGTLLSVLVALAAVIITGRLIGRLLAAVGQPPVIGEVLAGILLGPSLLGRVAPDVAAVVLPTSIAMYLGLIAQLGVVLYMFLVGLELEWGALHGRMRVVLVTSQLSIAVPFVLGVFVAFPLHARFAPPDIPTSSFALFMGVAMSITAFPVLARILTDRGMTKTPLGSTALACAAVGDVVAWCVLGLVVGIVQAQIGGAVISAALTLAYVILMFVVVRPLFARLLPALERTAHPAVAVLVVLVALAMSALATEWIGIHAIFGAFLLGAIIPSDRAPAPALLRGMHGPVTFLLLPAFFALTGMRTEVGLLSTAYDWAICAALILVATVGKFGGTVTGALLTGLRWREAAGLGVLMNTRGLMEIVVLGVGLDLGVISPAMFTMMVLMAVVTTMATTPLLNVIVDRAPSSVARS